MFIRFYNLKYFIGNNIAENFRRKYYIYYNLSFLFISHSVRTYLIIYTYIHIYIEKYRERKIMKKYNTNILL